MDIMSSTLLLRELCVKCTRVHTHGGYGLMSLLKPQCLYLSQMSFSRVTLTPSRDGSASHLLTYPHFDNPLWNIWDHKGTLRGSTNARGARTFALFWMRTSSGAEGNRHQRGANVSSLAGNPLCVCVCVCVFVRAGSKWVGVVPYLIGHWLVWNLMQVNTGSLWMTERTICNSKHLGLHLLIATWTCVCVCVFFSVVKSVKSKLVIKNQEPVSLSCWEKTETREKRKTDAGSLQEYAV